MAFKLRIKRYSNPVVPEAHWQSVMYSFIAKKKKKTLIVG